MAVPGTKKFAYVDKIDFCKIVVASVASSSSSASASASASSASSSSSSASASSSSSSSSSSSASASASASINTIRLETLHRHKYCRLTQTCAFSPARS